MKKTTKAKATPTMPAPPAKSKSKAVSSAKIISPKVSAAAAAAVAPAPAPAVKKTASQPKQESKSNTVKIKAQIDIGFGNALTIRGTGPDLSWDKGTTMNCVTDDLWAITLTGVSSPVVFKFLVNDLSWNVGEDYMANPGDEVTLVPAF